MFICGACAANLAAFCESVKPPPPCAIRRAAFCESVNPPPATAFVAATADATAAVKTLSQAATMEDLKTIYAKAFKAFQGDTEALKAIDAAKDARKTQLMEIA